MAVRPSTLACVLLCAAAVLPAATALSWPLCASGGNTWVTEKPQTDPRFPGANLWLFCESGLNILGDSVDPCLNNGSVCTPAVYNAVCKLLGYDRSGPEVQLARAQPGELVRSLTGEYCLRNGTYSRTAPAPDRLAAMPGQPCMRLEQLSCVRSLQRMSDSLESIVMEAVMAPKPSAAPATGSTAASPVQPQPQPAVAAAQGPPNGNRRLLRL